MKEIRFLPKVYVTINKKEHDKKEKENEFFIFDVKLFIIIEATFFRE